MANLLSNIKCLLLNDIRKSSIQLGSLFHTTSSLDKVWNNRNMGPRKFVEHNKQIFPPQSPEETPRPAYVCHSKYNIKYSPLKMWYIASFIRGMSIDEALKQLSFTLKKGASDIKKTLLEAQEMAVKYHNVEFKSNLWVSESFVGKGRIFKGVRRHARARVGEVEYKHCHYFVTLEEGKPPANYYLPYPQTPEQQLDKYMEGLRKRKIISSL